MRPTRITHEGLAEILKSTKGATIVSLSWVASDPARFKADKGRITKVSRYSGMINARYDKKKAKMIAAMTGLPVGVEDVEIKPVAWREREGKTAILRHKTKGTRYIEFYPASGGTEYTLDGVPCEYSKAAEFMRPKGKGPSVCYRTIKLEGITAATINGTKYVITH